MMKRTYKLLYIVGLVNLFAFQSCSDDILDTKPLNGYSDVAVFSDASLLRNYVNGAYGGLRTPFRDENTFTDGLSDNAYNQHGSAEAQIRRYNQGEVTRDNGESVTFNLWANAYYYIRRTNLFFEQIEGSPINEDELAVMEGEMHFLRAYNYFQLLKWYGGVPLINDTFELDQDSYAVERNSIDETVDFIVQELDLAISQLPGMNSVITGRASMEAAMALKGRTLLYAASPLFNDSNDQGKWQKAMEANRDVMNLESISLVDMSNWGAMFRGENNQEVIFEKQYSQQNNQGYGVNIWLFPNSNGGWATTTPTQSLVDSFELLSTGERPSESSNYDPQNPYQNRDPRFYETILYNGASFKDGTYDPYLDKDEPENAELAGLDSRISSISPHNATRTGYNFLKWSLPELGEFDGNTGRYIFFRKTEFYLNYAEAQIALGNEAEAKEAINEVRTSRGMPEVTSSGDELINDYRNETRVEFALEDHRFFDIRRWMIADEILDQPAMGVDVYKLSNGDFEYNYDFVTQQNRNWVERQYFLPIPFAEIQRSGGAIEQNPGYQQ
ncbi:RagB/SusD family nutrient uptake outer membrane protein [Zunongwangia endophytica]|uniref:RagB/SusD family nutrient uptake outer membrane protein n=1 Tax=Zunongwangia endophytica TaxID=1808945 RepID=A0ABV8H8Z8_9FLAO|nr:RagB/SusD family nutrient uptake outer membrane protein [Zunongwangia endophytica]MDN3593496.1 RagB/SusD family nutrient uptake outer membrane protein [Zunongwangia endophytica]